MATSADIKMSEVEKDNERNWVREEVEHGGGGTSSNSGDLFAEIRKFQQLLPSIVSTAVHDAVEGVRQDVKTVDGKVTLVDAQVKTVDAQVKAVRGKVTEHAQRLTHLEQKMQCLQGACSSAASVDSGPTTTA
eukprot:8323424-Pyramimonas_sp.AAC.1